MRSHGFNQSFSNALAARLRGCKQVLEVTNLIRPSTRVVNEMRYTYHITIDARTKSFDHIARH
jgi:hypothetical protein